MESYKIINEFISKLKSDEIGAANSIKLLISNTNFEKNIEVIDRVFFNNKLREINSNNYVDSISFIRDIHKIKSGEYNDFNIWSASKTHLKKSNKILIKRHDELNEIVGFPDNGNGLYKSFLGDKNLLEYIKIKFNINTKSISLFESNAKGFGQIPIDITVFFTDCVNSGLNYPPELITRYISSLATKPFVLLSGLSGSGKTKLAQAFAQWISDDISQYCIVPVGADWTNREPLLGYINALDNKEYILPENGALQLLIDANNNPKIPYFLILDEMNLSHVERYFADFLSVMESNDTFKLHSSQKSLNNNDNEKYDKLIEVPKEIGWPDNLFVVGTVNIDETTYMFSPKVLDRANVIEFRVGEDDLEAYFKPETNTLDMKKLWVEETKTGLGAEYGEDFVKISIEKTEKENLKIINDELIKFFKELQIVGSEFGYRTASEIQTLFGMIDLINPEYDKSEEFIKTYPKNYDFKIDVAIMQKLLPKIHGSRRKLSTPLKVLANLCLKEDTNNIFKENGEINITRDSIKYPLSFYKIARMYKNAIENGFASYAEA